MSSDIEIVKLNVGGDVFITNKNTLKQSPWFETFFSDEFKEPEKINGGQYFIDRDGYLFSLVLNYLRNGKTIKTSRFDKESDFEQFKDECDYFGLTVKEKWESDMQWYYIMVTLTSSRYVRFDANKFPKVQKLTNAGYKLMSMGVDPPIINVIFGKKINNSLVKLEERFHEQLNRDEQHRRRNEQRRIDEQRRRDEQHRRDEQRRIIRDKQRIKNEQYRRNKQHRRRNIGAGSISDENKT